MQKHTKIYLKEFGYDGQEFMPCEIPECGKALIDIHHIQRKGMGGSKTKDYIENLIGLCREHHDKFGDKKQYKEYLKKIHKGQLKDNG